MRMRINLLPTKFSKKRAQNVRDLIVMASVVGATLLGLFIWYSSLNNQLNTVKGNIRQVQNQIDKLSKEVAKVDEFKKNTKVLEDKLAVIEQLKAKKTGPVMVLDELATAITLVGDVWVTDIKESEGVMELSMNALRQDKISDFMLNLESRPKYFKDVKLLVTEAQKEKDSSTYYRFRVSCNVIYAADAQKPAAQE